MIGWPLVPPYELQALTLPDRRELVGLRGLVQWSSVIGWPLDPPYELQALTLPDRRELVGLRGRSLAE